MTFAERLDRGFTRNRFSPEVSRALEAEWASPEGSRQTGVRVPADATVSGIRVIGETRNPITKRAASGIRSAMWYRDNKKRHIGHMLAYQKARRPQLFEGRRNTVLKKRYGITSAEYDALLQKQNGSCAICSKKSETNRNGKLFVDHDHATGRIRGLLCLICNRAIADLTADQLRKAISYLEGVKE